MSELTRYPSYKDSGVPWLGGIPSHWSLIKTKYIFSFSRGLNITKKDLVDEGIPCINYGEIHSKYGFEVDPKVHKLKCVPEYYLDSHDSALLRNGDFVFADTSEDYKGSGNFSHLNSDINIFAGYHTIITRQTAENNHRYLAYVFDSLAFRNQVITEVTGVKVFSITQRVLKNSAVWLAPLKEQQAIVNFLDTKLKLIDSLILKQETLVEKLTEQRSSIITHTVTKGTNSNLPMKDSSIEWLEKIPNHWEIKSSRYVLSQVGSGKTPRGGAEVYIDEGVILIRSQNVHDDGLRLKDVAHITDEADNQQSNSRVLPDDVLLNITGASIGRANIVPKTFPRANVNQHVCILRSREDSIHPKFLLFLLQSTYSNALIQAEQNGTSREGINFEQIRSFKYPIPPLEDQEQIIGYLNTEIAKIEKMKNATKKIISSLKEYRSTLITQAITGKIDVRDFNSDQQGAS